MDFRKFLRTVHPVFRQALLEKYRNYVALSKYRPNNGKMIGFFGELIVARSIPHCFICGNDKLEYSFMNDLKGTCQHSWKDINCNKCNEFIVEIKSTTEINPIRLLGGSYVNYLQLPVEPYLMVNHGMYFENGKYNIKSMNWYLPGQYSVNRLNCGKSMIILQHNKLKIKNN